LRSANACFIYLVKIEDARLRPQRRSGDREYLASHLLSRALGTHSISIRPQTFLLSSDMPSTQLNQNKISTLQTLEPQLGSISTLETVYLEGNPCQKADVNYRRKIMLALPQLKQIDAT
jgi:hypothetical protein